MNEPKWLACAYPEWMLNHLRGKISNRKLRLFACACCRRIWHLMMDERSRAVVEAAERYADGLITNGDLAVARLAANAARGAHAASDAATAAWKAAWDAIAARAAAWKTAAWAATIDAANAARVTARAANAGEGAASAAWHAAFGLTCHATWDAQAHLLRDIVGNPFQPALACCATPQALSLAQAAYEERGEDGALDPVRLMVLADAVEEAGASGPLLDHLRSPGPHVRGCVALDAIFWDFARSR